MQRRNFLHTLFSGIAGTVAVAELDLDRLLWVPGQKTIFLPPPRSGNYFVSMDWFIAEALRQLNSSLALASHFNRSYDAEFGHGRLRFH